jgi:hypothetical protein
MRTEVARKDARRAEKLRHVGRRSKGGSSMVVEMAPVTRAALAKRQHRRQRRSLLRQSGQA